MAKLYLHLGGPKTGSTALQSFLSMNAPQLAAQGIAYPATGRSGVAQHQLAEVLLNRKGARGPLYRQLREEMQASAAETFIVSSETFFFLQDQITELPKLLQGFDVRPIVYFRRQDIWLEAMYTQIIKHPDYRYSGDIKDEQVFQMFDYYMDYLKLYERWSTPFGRQPTARLYERSRLPNGIIGDFCDVVGLRTDDSWQMPQSNEQQNLTLSPSALHMLRLINALRISGPEHNRVLDVLNQWDRLSSTAGSSYDYLSPGDRSKLLAQYAQSNSELARKIGLADGVLFADKIGKTAAPLPARITPTDITSYGGALALDMLKAVAEASDDTRGRV